MQLSKLFLSMLITFLSMHSLAQNVAPTISDPQALEVLEKKKEQTFQKLFKGFATWIYNLVNRFKRIGKKQETD